MIEITDSIDAFDTIESAIEDLKKGKVIIVCDDENRENEGDFVALVDTLNPKIVNFMISYGKGLVCAPISLEIAQNLNLKPMVTNNTDKHQTAFTFSIDDSKATTGISVLERYGTLKLLADPKATINDFRIPGHIFPLIAKEGGVLVRPGHTEAAVDLAILANVTPAAAICEIISPNGQMAKVPELFKLAKEHNLKIIHIKDLIHYRKTNDILITREVTANLPTKFGTFNIIGYTSIIEKQEIIVLTSLDFNQHIYDDINAPLVRVHSECLTGDCFSSLRCDCGDQLNQSLEQIQLQGGIFIYLRQEGRGIGLINKLKAYLLQDQGMDTVEANLHLGFQDDERDYYLASQVLKNLNISSINLLSNNPRKVNDLLKYGIKVLKRKDLHISSNEVNKSYLQVKKTKLGHLFN